MNESHLVNGIEEPAPGPFTSKYVRYEKIQSKLLSDFWGKPVYLGAHVLLPWGFDEHPNARYPLAINHGHFPTEIGGWRETPREKSPTSLVRPPAKENKFLKGTYSPKGTR